VIVLITFHRQAVKEIMYITATRLVKKDATYNLFPENQRMDYLLIKALYSYKVYKYVIFMPYFL